MSDKLRRTESLPLEPREASSCRCRWARWNTLEASLAAWVMFVWGVCWRALLQSIFCTCLNPYIPFHPQVKPPLSKLFSQSLGSGLCSSAPRTVGRARADSLAFGSFGSPIARAPQQRSEAPLVLMAWSSSSLMFFLGKAMCLEFRSWCLIIFLFPWGAEFLRPIPGSSVTP